MHCVLNYTYSNDSRYENVITVIIIKVVLYAPKREVGVVKPQSACVSKVYIGVEITNKVILFALGYDQVMASRNPMIVAAAFHCHTAHVLCEPSMFLTETVSETHEKLVYITILL